MAELQTWEEAVKLRKRRNRIIFWSIFAALVLFIVGFYKVAPYTETDAFCNNCHKMQPYYLSWQQSNHSNVSCFRCHFNSRKKIVVKPTHVTTKKYWSVNLGNDTVNISKYMNWLKRKVVIVNKYVDESRVDYFYTKDKLKDLGQITLMVLGGRKDGQERTWNQCNSCHSQVISKDSKLDTSGHAAHIKAGLTCEKCHGDTAHEDIVKTKRQDCLGCHKKGLPIPKSHGSTDFKFGHGKLYIKSQVCRICHAQGAKDKLCMDCHGVIMPHPANFLPVHVQSIPKVGIQKCVNCHGDNKKSAGIKSNSPSCSKCHGKNLFHKGAKRDILKNHGKQAAVQGTSGCYGCHGENACAKCHRGVPMPHPKNIKAIHGKLAKNYGLNSCAGYCHQSIDSKAIQCTRCHGPIPIPHPSDFAQNHFGYKNFACRACHKDAEIARKTYCVKCHVVGYDHWHQKGKCTPCHIENPCGRCHGG